jgi:hypothetical protein
MDLAYWSVPFNGEMGHDQCYDATHDRDVSNVENIRAN